MESGYIACDRKIDFYKQPTNTNEAIGEVEENYFYNNHMSE